MAVIGREAARAPLTSADINDGIITADDLIDTLDLSGKTITLGALSATGNISFGDNDKAIFGAGSDLQIYHDGSNSIIEDTSTGNLQIITNGNAIALKTSDGDAMLSAIKDGDVKLYYDNNLKLATTATGVDVTGTVTADGLTVDGKINYTSAVNGILNAPASMFINIGSTQYREQNIVSYAAADYSIATSGAYNLTFKTNNTEAMRIDSSGNLLVGKTAAGIGTAGFEVAPSGYFYATRNGNSMALNRLTTDGDLAVFLKDGTTVGSIGVYDGRPYLASTTVGIRVSNALFPSNTTGVITDGAMDIGGSSGRFNDIYATNGTIQTSDVNEKQDIEALSEAEQRVAVAAKGLLRKFRWISSVEEKGDDARIHFGIIAQDLQAAFEAEGLDAGRYAMFIHSTWTDEETGEERSRMGVRYSELLAFIIAAL